MPEKFKPSSKEKKPYINNLTTPELKDKIVQMLYGQPDMTFRQFVGTFNREFRDMRRDIRNDLEVFFNTEKQNPTKVNERKIETPPIIQKITKFMIEGIKASPNQSPAFNDIIEGYFEQN